jgi:ribosomal protein S18 acetylase RimI-like enzyme
MSQINIAQATIPSLPATSRLFARAVDTNFTYFSEAVRRRVIREHSIGKLLLATLDPRRIVLIARTGGRIIGYCLGAAPTKGPAQIYWLYVAPDHRGANIGLSLMSRMLKALAQRGAQEVVIATHDHRRYYERQGFQFVQKTVVDGVDMDILTFKLKT